MAELEERIRKIEQEVNFYRGAGAVLLLLGITLAGYVSFVTSNLRNLEQEKTAFLSFVEEQKISFARSASDSVISYFPQGSIMFTAGACPQGFSDVTNSYDGRLVGVSNQTHVDNIELVDGDGSHTHPPVKHSHTVTGAVDRNSIDATRHGNSSNFAIVNWSKLTVSGKTSEDVHSHSGGHHVHGAIGLRVCKMD